MSNRVTIKNENYSETDRRVTDYSNDDIYINLNIFNPITNTHLIPAIYNEQRVQSLFSSPRDWKCALINLYCPTTNIPLFEWHNFLPDNVTPFYTVTLVVKNYNAFEPDISATQQVLFTPYNETNFVYLFNQIVISVNNAFATCLNSLITAYNLTEGPNAWQNNVNLPQSPPILYNDTDDSLFTLIVPFLYNAQPSESDPINPNRARPFVQISINYRLNRLFDNWPSVNQGEDPLIGNNIVLRVYDTKAPGWLGFSNNYYPAIPPLPTTLVPNAQWQYNLKQQNSTTSLISSIKAIVIGSTMPLRYEFTNTINSTTGSLGAVGLLTDFSISISSANNGESEQPIIYNPTPQYHWIDVLAGDQFNILNFSIQYVDVYDQFRMIMIAPGETATAKLLFSKK